MQRVWSYHMMPLLTSWTQQYRVNIYPNWHPQANDHITHKMKTSSETLVHCCTLFLCYLLSVINLDPFFCKKSMPAWIRGMSLFLALIFAFFGRQKWPFLTALVKCQNCGANVRNAVPIGNSKEIIWAMINDHVNDCIVQIAVWHRNSNISTAILTLH